MLVSMHVSMQIRMYVRFTSARRGDAYYVYPEI